MKPSLNSRIFAWILKVLNFKKKVEKRAFKQIQAPRKEFRPNWIMRSYWAHFQTFQGKGITTFESKEKVTTNHIIFFHGGAYIFEAAPNHWRFAEKIVKRSFCRMTLVDYPLAPEHNYNETFEMVKGAYD